MSVNPQYFSVLQGNDILFYTRFRGSQENWTYKPLAILQTLKAAAEEINTSRK